MVPLRTRPRARITGRGSRCLAEALAILWLSAPGLFGQAGTLDVSFDAGGGTDGAVTCLRIDSRGRILVAGEFENVAGVDQPKLARFLPEGRLDDTFKAPEFSGVIQALAIQSSDSTILVGGDFSEASGVSRANLVRLTRDGAWDSRFTLETDQPVASLLAAPNGDVYAGGDFTQFTRGTTKYARNYVGRFQGNSVESWNRAGTDEFDGPSFSVYALALQADGRLLIGGDFSSIYAGEDSADRPGIARLLNRDGINDPTFDPGEGANGTVWCLALEADGSILVGGEFTKFGGARHEGLARLRSNGSVDPNFAPQFGTNAWIRALARQSDGKILVGGDFVAVGQQRSFSLTRLHTDGSLDATFVVGEAIEDGVVTAIATQPDGQILIAGDFTMIAGKARGGLARINGDQAPRISRGPDPQNPLLDQPAELSVVATSPAQGGPLTYRWFKDGQPLLEDARVRGVSGPRLTLLAADLGDDGLYSVVVSNSVGAVASDEVEMCVEVAEPARIDAESVFVEAGQIEFLVTGGGTGAVVIESSADLAAWVPVLTNATPTDLIRLPVTGPQRFFRFNERR